MQKFILILAVLVCVTYSLNRENKACDNSPASPGLKQFEESAEEFTEEASETIDIDSYLGTDDEFLESSHPVPKLPQPELIQNHNNTSAPLVPLNITEEVFSKKTEWVIPSINEYSLILPLTFYHPPRA